VRVPRCYHVDLRDNGATDDDGLVLLDWQMSVRGLGASDVVWLSWWLTPDVRWSSWDVLFGAYLDEWGRHGVTGYQHVRSNRTCASAWCSRCR
jgi:hypothetical protein